MSEEKKDCKRQINFFTVMIKEILTLLFPDLNNRSNNSNELDECFDKWKNYREQLISQKRDLEKQIDKTVFSISSGAIGISLIVIDKLFPAGNNYYILPFIGLAWISLIISLIYQCYSFLKTSKSIKNSITKVEEIVQSETLEQAIEKEEEYYSDWQGKNMKIDKYNKNAFRFMIFGIIFLLLFSSLCLFSRVQRSNRQINLTSYDSLKIEILK